jgi:hypothetical protein
MRKWAAGAVVVVGATFVIGGAIALAIGSVSTGLVCMLLGVLWVVAMFSARLADRRWRSA